MWVIPKVHLQKAEFEAQRAIQRAALASNNITQISYPLTTTTQVSNPTVTEGYTAATQNMDSPSIHFTLRLLLALTNFEASCKILVTLQMLRVLTIQISKQPPTLILNLETKPQSSSVSSLLIVENFPIVIHCGACIRAHNL